VVNHPLPASSEESFTGGTKSRLARVGKVVHPCRVKSFRKAVSTVMDDLGMDSEIIDNFNRMVKLGNLKSDPS
jgi:hypothetical protein